MYRNLEAEMVREGISRKDLAELLEVRYATIIDKLKGKFGFTLDEAFKIRNSFFSDLSFEYLFEVTTTSAS
ncbi:phage protein [Alkaliphilus metalliredigens QYMF]|uniref:Phage protein n=1 Tax=Alkaliphilus metalliredigens (strain QYMF) TaxID=293826 RepID=A6TLJ6_ALKMQ|nr:phage protein [Alkaliphilus metalliredigens]ABR47064.1 phage protein [Alkaliphilus metalliredigens QYMF]